MEKLTCISLHYEVYKGITRHTSQSVRCQRPIDKRYLVVLIRKCYDALGLSNKEEVGRRLLQQEQHPHRLTLASASPRRRELLRYLIPNFDMLATTGEEHDRWMPPALTAMLPAFPLDIAQHPTLLAWRKVMAAQDEHASGILLGADTIVVLDGDVLNKPRDAEEAQMMLRRLTGRTHRVYTGVVAMSTSDAEPRNIVLELDSAEVRMAAVSDAEITAYVATGEPLDKAGAYGIQGLGGRLVEQVTGSYTCVVGLPLVTTWRVLTTIGLNGITEPDVAFKRWLADQGRKTPACIAP